MSKLHVVLVCHTELDFGGGWGCYDWIQPGFEKMLDTVAQSTGKAPKVTYCATSEFLSEKLDEAYRLLGAGHEIGIHSHLPGQHRPNHRYDGRHAFRFYEDGTLNHDAVAPALRQIAIALGLPPPVTHVSAMFSFQKSTIRTLECGGFRVDCSLMPGVVATHPATGDFLLADNSRRTLPQPYRASRDDPWADGDSAVIELPVSGNLGSFDAGNETARIDERLRGERQVDVYQSFWHHFEFGNPKWEGDRFSQATEFLMHCARNDNVVFSTAAEAADVVRASLG